MALSAQELARRDANGLQTQQQPVRGRWTIDDVPAADEHALRCTFSCGLRALDDPAELRTLQDVLMGPKSVVTVDEVVRYFQPTLAEAARTAARDKGVTAWLEDKDLLARELQRAAEKVAFACGLEVLPPFDLSVESPSFEQQRLKELQRKLAEQEAAGRIEAVNRAAELLNRFEQLRQKAPDLPPGAILSQLSPMEQGSALQALMLASAKQQEAHDLWCVSGEYLVRIDARNPSRTTDLVAMPPTLGPLRSVHSAHVDGRRRLLVGARDGFFLASPDDPAMADAYVDNGINSQQGFSRVLFQHGSFVGVHGEGGVVRWPQAVTDSPRLTIRPERFAAVLDRCASGGPPPLPGSSGSSVSFAGTNVSFAGSGASIAMGTRTPGPRNLFALDDHRLLLSVGCKLYVIDGDELGERSSASPAEIVAIVPDGRTFAIVHEDGTIALLDGPTCQIQSTRHRPMRVRSACGLPWLGSTRLLLAGDQGAVQCVGLNDSLVSEYASAHRGLRALAGSAGLIAGVSADRQRIILWEPWDGRAPVAEVYVTARTKHRIADVEFA